MMNRYFLAALLVVSAGLMADGAQTPTPIATPVTPLKGGYSATIEGYQFAVTYFNGIPEIQASYVQIDLNKKILNSVPMLYVSSGVSESVQTQILAANVARANSVSGVKLTHKESSRDFSDERYRYIESFDPQGILVFSRLENESETFIGASSSYDLEGKIATHNFYYRFILDRPFSTKSPGKTMAVTTMAYLLKKYPGHNLTDPKELEKFCERVFDDIVLKKNGEKIWQHGDNGDSK